MAHLEDLIEKVTRKHKREEQEERRIPTVRGVDLFHIPKEILIHLFSFLEIKNLLSASLVNHSFHNLTNEPLIWKIKYIQYWNDHSDKENWKVEMNTNHSNSKGCIYQ